MSSQDMAAQRYFMIGRHRARFVFALFARRRGNRADQRNKGPAATAGPLQDRSMMARLR